MKKLICIALFVLSSFAVKAQSDLPIPITSGMTGLQLRAALNEMFDTIFFNFGNLDPFTVGINSRVDTLLEAYHWYINPKDFGALGDNITECYHAFDTSLYLAALTGKPIIVPPGTYKISTPLVEHGFNKNSPFMMLGIGKAVLNFSSVASVDFLSIATTRGVAEAITSPIALNDTTITVDMTGLTIVKDDLLEIISTDKWNLDQQKGELVRVKNVSGNNIHLYRQTYEGYNAGTTTIQLINASKAIVNNIKMLGPTTHSGLSDPGFSVSGFYNVDIRGLMITQEYGFSLSINYCYGGIIDNCTFEDAYRFGSGYGIAVNATQFLTIKNSLFENCRNAISLVGVYPCRDIIMIENVFNNIPPYNNGAAIDGYGGEKFVIANNIFSNCGIGLAKPDATITGNVITNGSIGIDIRYANDRANYFLIDKNQLNEGNIFLSYEKGFIGSFKITNNIISKISSTTNWDLISIANRETMPTYNVTVNDLVISNNILIDSTTTLTRAIFINENFTVRSAKIDNNTIYTRASQGMYFNEITASYFSIKNNIVESGSMPLIIYAASSGFFDVSNNYLNSFSGKANPIYDKTWLQFNGNLVLKDNIFNNLPGRGGVNIFQTVDTAWIYKNIFKGSNSSAIIDTADVKFTDLLLEGSLTDGAPTEAQINSITGLTPAIAKYGYTTIIKDSDGSGLIYIIQTDENGWYWQTTTLAL